VWRAIEWVLLGAGSFGAIIAGVRIHRPARIAPWLLLGGTIAALAMGDVFFALNAEVAAEICYLSMFGFMAGALLQFTGGGSLLDDRARLIDLLAFTSSMLLVIWVFVVGDNGQIGQISPADVIGSLLLIAVTLRMNLATGRNISAALLLTGSFGLLAGDILYPLFPGRAAETGFIVLYAAWGLAALHPSMTRLTEPMPPKPSSWPVHWAALLGVSAATPPAVLLIEALSADGVRDGVVIAVAGGITLLLTITRLADSVTQNGRAAARERALRVANTNLVSAADDASVDEAVRAAVTQLVPAQAIKRVVFATDDRQLAAAELPKAPSGTHRRSWWTHEAGRVEPAPARSALPRLFNSGTESAESAAEGTLVCPLWLEPLAVARPNGGALVLTGRRDVLTIARDAFEVLAGQAALALDRISLVEAVGRRDSDLYLRAVIRSTADLMLVVDEDRRIRYASPALHELLDQTDLSPLATWEDLVHPDDRGQVRRAFSTEGDGRLFCALLRPGDSQVLVEATYRDLREDRLVQGFVVTLRHATEPADSIDQLPRRDHIDDLPAWVNRRSAQHKFRY
jgi:PAS domain S-box-containing protein